MSTVRAAITAAVFARMQPLAAGGLVTGVYKHRPEQFDRQDAPAIGVSWETDDIRSSDSVGRIDRALGLVLSIYTRGEDPDALADPIAAAAHAALFSDATLGGIAQDILETGAALDVDSADTTAAMLQMRYQVWYRTTREDITQ